VVASGRLHEIVSHACKRRVGKGGGQHSQSCSEAVERMNCNGIQPGDLLTRDRDLDQYIGGERPPGDVQDRGAAREWVWISIGRSVTRTAGVSEVRAIARGSGRTSTARRQGAEYLLGKWCHQPRSGDRGTVATDGRVGRDHIDVGDLSLVYV